MKAATRKKVKGSLLAGTAITLIAVHVDVATHRPQPLPQAVRDALDAFDVARAPVA